MLNGQWQQHGVCLNRKDLGMELVWASRFSLCKVRMVVVLFLTHFSDNNVEMASLVCDIHLHLSLLSEESMKDDESLYAK